MPSSPHLSPHVAIVLARSACETFVQAEIDALQAAGLPLRTLSLAQRARISAAPPRPRVSRRAMCRLLPLTPRPRQFLALLRRLPLICAVAPELSPADHLHAQFAFLPADAAALLADLSGASWSCALHAQDIFTQTPSRLRRRLQDAAFLTTCTRLGSNTLTAIASLPPTHLIRHPVQIQRPPTTTQNSPPLLIAVGRLVRKKGFDTLIHALADLRVTHRSDTLRCEIVGEGPERKRLQKLIAKLRLEQTVTLAGALPHDKTLERIASATALVLPSRQLANGDRDGIANVLLEAMGAGTPVITTTAGAAEEVVTDGETGLLVPADAPDALASAVKVLLEDRALCGRLSSHARERVATQFSPQACFPPLIELLRNQLA